MKRSRHYLPVSPLLRPLRDFLRVLIGSRSFCTAHFFMPARKHLLRRQCLWIFWMRNLWNPWRNTYVWLGPDKFWNFIIEFTCTDSVCLCRLRIFYCSGNYSLYFCALIGGKNPCNHHKSWLRNAFRWPGHHKWRRYCAHWHLWTGIACFYPSWILSQY